MIERNFKFRILNFKFIRKIITFRALARNFLTFAFCLLTFTFVLIPPVYAACAPSDLACHFGFARFTSLAEAISNNIIPTAFEIAGIAVLFYTVIAAVKYMISGGDKEAVASARAMITHSIIGFLLLIVLFLFMQYIFPALGFDNFVIVR